MSRDRDRYVGEGRGWTRVPRSVTVIVTVSVFQSLSTPSEEGSKGSLLKNGRGGDGRERDGENPESRVPKDERQDPGVEYEEETPGRDFRFDTRRPDTC